MEGSLGRSLEAIVGSRLGRLVVMRWVGHWEMIWEDHFKHWWGQGSEGFWMLHWVGH